MLHTSKIIIGSAQFGLDYGINNTSGQVSRDGVFEILSSCAKYEISKIDTAYAYGNSEAILGAYFHDNPTNKFDVISKLPKGTHSSHAASVLDQSISRLNHGLYALLFHDYQDFLNDHERYTEQLQGFKESGKIQKFGYSLYHPDELKKIIELDLPVEIIQIPYSVLARDFELLFPLLKSEYNTEIHTRSTFLQGLYFMDPQKLPSKLGSLRPALFGMREYCKEQHLDYLSFLLSCPLKNSQIDGVIVGIDSIEQFNEIIEASTHDLSKVPDFRFNVEDKNLLNPAGWTK